jgi:hypothetical protein
VTKRPGREAAHLLKAPSVRMSGAIPLLRLYAFFVADWGRFTF